MVVVDEQRVPFGRFLVTDEMRLRDVVDVIDEVELIRRGQAVLGHDRLEQHAAVRVLDPVSRLQRAEIGQKVQLALFARNGRRIDRFLADVFRLFELFQLDPADDDRSDRDRKDHDARDQHVDAEAVSGMHLARVVRIIQDVDRFADLVGGTVGTELFDVLRSVDGVFDFDRVLRIVVLEELFLLLDRNDLGGRFLKALRVEERKIHARSDCDERDYKCNITQTDAPE